MSMQQVYLFDDCYLQVSRRMVTRGTERIPLTPKEFATLLYLVERAGTAVPRQELTESIWPDTSVGETSLARNISVLRRHFGSDCIRVVPKFGYRFDIPVSPSSFVLRPAEKPDEPEPPRAEERLELPETPLPDAVLRSRAVPHWVVATGLLAVFMAFLVVVVGARSIQQRLGQHRPGAGKTSLMASSPGQRHRPSEAARQIYLHGQFELEQRTLESYQDAAVLFQQAIAIDPEYGEAYVGLSQAYIFMGGIVAETEMFPKAEQAALTALRLDPENAAAHRNRAYLLMNAAAAMPESEREYLVALRLNPHDARTHHWYAQLLAGERRTAESVREAEAGYELEPSSVASGANYAFMLTQDGRAAEAVTILEQLLRREPNNDMAWGYLGFSELKLHRYRKSASAFRNAANRSTLKVNYLACEAYALSQLGDRRPVLKMLKVFDLRRQRREWIPAQSMVLLYLGLGDREAAIDWLRRGLSDHSTTSFELATDPVYSELHSSKGFNELYVGLGRRD